MVDKPISARVLAPSIHLLKAQAGIYLLTPYTRLYIVKAACSLLQERKRDITITIRAMSMHMRARSEDDRPKRGDSALASAVPASSTMDKTSRPGQISYGPDFRAGDSLRLKKVFIDSGSSRNRLYIAKEERPQTGSKQQMSQIRSCFQTVKHSLCRDTIAPIFSTLTNRNDHLSIQSM